MDSHISNTDPRDAYDDQPEVNPAEQQWLSAKIRLRPELTTDFRNEHDGLFVVIEDPVRNKFYSVGRQEFQFLSSLDGEMTVAEIIQNKNLKIEEKTAIAISSWAVQSNLVVGDQMNSTARLERQSQAIDRQKLMAAINPISIKFNLFNPNTALKKITPACKWLFSPAFVAVWLVVGCWGITCAWTQSERLGAASIGIFSGYRWFWLLVVWAILKVIHEAAHGVACRKYGGDVNEAGVLLLLFTPMAFVNVTSSWRFPNRWHRIVVAAAGMYVELFIAFVALIVWANSSDGIVSDICYNIFFMSSVTTILFNANPLMRFDGYYILADSLGVTNLYTKGTKLFGDQLRSRFFGVPLTPNLCQKSEQNIVAVYGTLAWFWKILISLGLIIGASVLFHGAGKAIAVIGAALFFGLPIWNQLKQLYGPTATLRPDSRRVAFNFALLGIIVISLFSLIRAPATKSAPAIVQFKDETPIRAESDGFIDQILVIDGQNVSKGQTLIVLNNPQMNLEINQLQHESEGARIQARIHRQSGEIALFQAERERLNGLLTQLAQCQAEADALKIVAPFDGFVFHRNLDSTIGSFARQGDTLLNMAEEQTKEIVVAIEQRDWESLKGKSGTSMRVAMRSQSIFPAPISHIDARATDIPKHPSLCANIGGPLPIKTGPNNPDDESAETDFRLLTPHFYVDLELGPEVSQNLRSGQRGRAFFATKQQSLGSYMYVEIEKWLKNKIDIATQTAVF